MAWLTEFALVVVYDADNSGSIDEEEFQKIYQIVLSRPKGKRKKRSKRRLPPASSSPPRPAKILPSIATVQSVAESPREAARRIFAAAVADSDQKSLNAQQIAEALQANGHDVSVGLISGMFSGAP
jgi:hypothetical protein